MYAERITKLNEFSLSIAFVKAVKGLIVRRYPLTIITGVQIIARTAKPNIGISGKYAKLNSRSFKVSAVVGTGGAVFHESGKVKRCELFLSS